MHAAIASEPKPNRLQENSIIRTTLDGLLRRAISIRAEGKQLLEKACYRAVSCKALFGIAHATSDCYVTGFAREYKTTIATQPTIQRNIKARYQTTIFDARGSLFIQSGVAKIHDSETANRAT